MFGILKNVFGQTGNDSLTATIKNGAFLVDVRSPMEFSSGSVPGAVNIPLDRIQSQLTKFNNRKSIVVFCRSGNRSSQAQRVLEANGFQNVVNGGTWQNVNNAVKKLEI